jgi:microcystin-dependent protein
MILPYLQNNGKGKGLGIMNKNKIRIRRIVLVGALALFATGFVSAQAQDHYIAEIRLFAGNFAPVGWAICDGSLLPIAQNTALFSLLGTMYGGDGVTTFAIPDLRGRVPIGAGAGNGLTARVQGDKGGQENVTILVSQLPAHTHTITLAADSTVATTDRPASALPARSAGAIPSYGKTANTALSSGSAVAGSTGGGLPLPVMQPYTSITYIIALQGIFPPRN